MHNYFSGASHEAIGAGEMDHDLASEVLDDGSLDGEIPLHKSLSTKNRNRRASEGSHLIKGGGKRVTSEVRCDTCGKGYKHSSCLTKHMYEMPVGDIDLVLTLSGGNTIRHGPTLRNF